MIEKRDIWFLVGVALILLAILMFWGVVRAAPSYSNVGQNDTYLGMNESIELRAKWTPEPAPYDVSKGYLYKYISVSDSSLQDVAFNNDGTKMYVVGNGNDRIYEYSLSTPYDISTATYNDYLDVSGQDAGPKCITFNNDGTKLYLSGTQNQRVYEYNLSTAYDISTATYNDYLSVGIAAGIAFNNDGTKLYVVFSTYTYEYNLSTPYDISTGVYNDNLTTSAQDSYMHGIAFNDDGTKLYLSGMDNDCIYEYNLSTPYDISTGVYNDMLNVSSTINYIRGITFSGTGDRVYIVDDSTSQKVYEYYLANYTLDTAVLSVNISGSWENVSTIYMNSGIPNWSNFSYSPAICNKVVGWKITVNDSSGASNTTTIGTFYVMPYIYQGQGLTATCTNKHNATITPSTTGDINATFLAPYIVRNATFKECSYEITEGADRVIITNATEYCNITVINLDAESGTSFYLQEYVGLSAFPPPNLPSAIAATGLVIIVIYSITTRRR